MMGDISSIITIVFAAFTIIAASVVAFSRNLIYSAFALLGVFAGVLGLYVLLSADFVAVIQFIIYIGGILVLVLFAVMLTTKIGERKLSNKSMAPWLAFICVAAFGVLMWEVVMHAKFNVASIQTFAPTTAAIGELLLKDYLLPFEIVSLVLVLVLVGAVALARREVK